MAYKTLVGEDWPNISRKVDPDRLCPASLRQGQMKNRHCGKTTQYDQSQKEDIDLSARSRFHTVESLVAVDG